MSTNKIKKGIASDSIVFILTVSIGFAVVPLYLSYISIVEYGIYVAVQAIVAVVSLADIGLTLYLTKKLSNDKLFKSKNVKTALSSAQIFQYSLAVLLLLLGVLISAFTSKILNVDSDFAIETNLLFLFAWFSVIVSVVFGLNHAILKSRHELQFMNYAIFMILVLSSGLNIVFLHQGFSIKWMGLSLFLSTLIVNLFILFSVYKKYDIFILKIAFFDKHFVKDGWQYVKQFQILRIAQVSKTSLFTILLSSYAGQTLVAQYNVTNKVPGIVPAFISKVVMNFFPRFSSYLERGKIDELQNEYKVIFRYSIFVTVFVGLAIWLANPSFVFMWVGQEIFIDNQIFLVMIITMAVMLLTSFTGLIIQASGDFQLMPHFSMLEVIVFLILSYVLFQLNGVIGFFIGFAISSSIGLLYSFVLVSKIIRMNIFKWLKADYLRLLLVSLLIVGVDYFLKDNLESNWLYLFCFTLILLPMFIYFSNQYVNLKLLLKGRVA